MTTSKAAAMNTQKILKEGQLLAPSPDLRKVREEILQLVSRNASAMVQKTIDEVNKGHYAAMKFLFEMTGLYPAFSPEDNREGDGLAKLLLERLGICGESELEAGDESLQIVPGRKS